MTEPLQFLQGICAFHAKQVNIQFGRIKEEL